MNFAICYNTFIPLRSDPSEKSEMISQILFGEYVEIIENDKTTGYSKVRNSFDDYEGWCTISLLHPLELKDIISLKENKISITRDILMPLEAKDGISRLYLGAGSTVYVNKNLTLEVRGISYIIPERLSITQEYKTQERIISSAKKFINIPYLWGGRSSFGIDCSGFVQNIYKQAGIPLPRDAWQQSECGKLISFIEESLPGDIMFFDNEDGKITHTGIFLGNNKIIHSSGRVRIDSIDHQGIFSAEVQKYTHKLRIIRRIIFDLI